MSHFGIKLPTVLLRRKFHIIHSLVWALEPRIYNVKTINYHISTYFKFIVWSRRLCRIRMVISLFLFNEFNNKRRWCGAVENQLASHVDSFSRSETEKCWFSESNQKQEHKMCGSMRLYQYKKKYTSSFSPICLVNARIHIHVLKSVENDNKKNSTYSTSFSIEMFEMYGVAVAVARWCDEIFTYRLPP